ncbi:hypothetical protein PG987_016669 [Apiospora arundinis]
MSNTTEPAVVAGKPLNCQIEEGMLFRATKAKIPAFSAAFFNTAMEGLPIKVMDNLWDTAPSRFLPSVSCYLVLNSLYLANSTGVHYNSAGTDNPVLVTDERFCTPHSYELLEFCCTRALDRKEPYMFASGQIRYTEGYEPRAEERQALFDKLPGLIQDLAVSPEPGAVFVPAIGHACWESSRAARVRHGAGAPVSPSGRELVLKIQKAALLHQAKQEADELRGGTNHPHHLARFVNTRGPLSVLLLAERQQTIERKAYQCLVQFVVETIVVTAS